MAGQQQQTAGGVDLDMMNRDPNDINNHIKVQLYDSVDNLQT